MKYLLCCSKTWVVGTHTYLFPSLKYDLTNLPICLGQSNRDHYLSAAHLSPESRTETEDKARWNPWALGILLYFIQTSFLIFFKHCASYILIKKIPNNSLGNLLLVSAIGHKGGENIQGTGIGYIQYLFCFGRKLFVEGNCLRYHDFYPCTSPRKFLAFLEGFFFVFSKWAMFLAKTILSFLLIFISIPKNDLAYYYSF